ncbi:MAG: FAD binding domain-containing protein [Anaerolineaceae bacterium]|nr:FAD binding domain-containing protein [Anaerolineaceae bacterium]
MWQNYLTPYSLPEALELKSKHQTNARLVAGATDLIVELEHNINPVETLIDITHLPDLDKIWLDDQKQVHIGPLVTHNQVVASKLCRDFAFPLVKACWNVGSPQIRNRGTVAGNLVTASPANDTITPLWALDALIKLESMHGSRIVTFPEFFTGVKKTAIQPDEMITDIFFPAMSQGFRGTFLKLGLRKALAISVVDVAVVLKIDGKSVSEARIALGSVAPTIIRVASAENFLIGKQLTSEVLHHAGELAAQAINPISDIRGSSTYRRYMTGVLVRNALKELAEGVERESIPARPVMLWGKTNGKISRNGEEKQVVHSKTNNQPIVTTINGLKRTVTGANHKTLLQMLREDMGLTGGKEGCAEGECGACTVLMDGIAVLGCMTPAPQAHGRQITTIESVAQGDQLHPIQKSFVDWGAVQCGYCIPGFIMSGVALVDELEHPDREDIKQAFSGNLCRCTGYYPIIKAMEDAVRTGEE